MLLDQFFGRGAKERSPLPGHIARLIPCEKDAQSWESFSATGVFVRRQTIWAFAFDKFVAHLIHKRIKLSINTFRAF